MHSRAMAGVLYGGRDKLEKNARRNWQVSMTTYWDWLRQNLGEQCSIEDLLIRNKSIPITCRKYRYINKL